MSKRTRTAVWGVLVAVGFIALSWIPPIPAVAPRAKVRAQRITPVNTVRSVTFTLTNTAALSGTRPGTGN